MANMFNKDKSIIARGLIDYGWVFLMIKLYRKRKIFLATVASKRELSMSETIDLLSEFGMESPIDYDDYLKRFEALK